MVDTVVDFLGLVPMEPMTSMGELLPYMVTVGVTVIMCGMVFRAMVEIIKAFTPWRWGV